MIHVLNRSVHPGTLARRYADAVVLDLTSRGDAPWVRFSPFFPHGDLPVPLWSGRTAASVEGIWQGLKRFEHEDEVDERCFENRTMKGLKRTSRGRGRSGVPRGECLGHQAGPDRSAALLGYLEARRRIYVPAYRLVLERHLGAELEELRRLDREGAVVLLDFTTNDDVDDLRRPLSHAALVRRFVEGTFPT